MTGFFRWESLLGCMIFFISLPVFSVMIPLNGKVDQFVISLPGREVEITEVTGLDAIEVDGTFKVMPSGVGKTKKYYLAYTRSLVQSPDAVSQLFVFYPFADAEKEPVCVDLKQIGLDMEYFPDEMESMTPIKSGDMSAIKEIGWSDLKVVEPTEPEKLSQARAVAVHRETSDGGEIHGELVLLFDKRRSCFVAEYHNQLKRYLINLTLELARKLSMSLTGVAGILMQNGPAWLDMMIRCPLDIMQLQLKNPARLPQIVNGITRSPLPDSLEWRAGEHRVGVISRCEGAGLQNLWTLDICCGQSDGVDQLIPDTKTTVNVETFVSCFPYVLCALRERDGADGECLALMLEKNAQWKQLSQFFLPVTSRAQKTQCVKIQPRLSEKGSLSQLRDEEARLRLKKSEVQLRTKKTKANSFTVKKAEAQLRSIKKGESALRLKKEAARFRLKKEDAQRRLKKEKEEKDSVCKALARLDEWCERPDSFVPDENLRMAIQLSATHFMNSLQRRLVSNKERISGLWRGYQRDEKKRKNTKQSTGAHSQFLQLLNDKATGDFVNEEALIEVLKAAETATDSTFCGVSANHRFVMAQLTLDMALMSSLELFCEGSFKGESVLRILSSFAHYARTVGTGRLA